MFLRGFVEILAPADVAGELLARLPETLIQSFALDAIDHGNTVLAEVGFPVAGRRLDKQVQIEVGSVVRTRSRTWLPIWWRATGAVILFPSLEGELEAAPLGNNRTQIGLSARYTPPFGAFGTTLDRMLLHRIAEATIHDFLQQVAAALETQSRLQRVAEA